MAILGIDLGSSDQTINSSNADATNTINLTAVGSHTLTVDGVSATVGSFANVSAAAAPSFAAINGGSLTVDYGVAGVSALTAVSYNVGDSSSISVTGPALLGVTLGTQTVNFSGNGSGSFAYTKGLIDTVSSFNVNGFSWGDSLGASGYDFDNFTYDSVSGNATLVLERGLFGADKFTYNINGINASLAAAIQANPSSFFNSSTDVFTAPVCFLRGTLIETDNGEIAVEDIQAGDKVRGRSGMREVRWVGYRHDWVENIPSDKLDDFWPILVKRDAVSENVPSKDIRVSPWHHLYVDGVLIRAKDLVNGSTIVADKGMKRLSYYHIELDQFDVIHAHGIYSESYTDGGNRDFFHNADVTSLKPEDRTRREGSRPGFHAVRDQQTIDAIHKRLADRAIQLDEALPLKRSA
ncbi:Hint domain-containing protein [Sphingobium sp. BYY-5]|uniref:Hint domain-containing protein n=1 Tax=Sphingobium sp. BYY-5 TaxID=2926400 RepID=UPI001FA7C4CE|nr:Hint domain-containing protein [Sphingobium sp. BYY-5]MCI4589267.1 Hint domain-containing protein [Sphingobium sp. BYY-5]